MTLREMYAVALADLVAERAEAVGPWAARLDRKIAEMKVAMEERFPEAK